MPERLPGTHGIRIALLSYLIVVSVQLFTYFLTNVLVLLAQAMEMLSDVFVSAFLLLSISWSKKPADEFHISGKLRGRSSGCS